MKLQNYLGVFQNKTYTKLFLAKFISQMGTVTGLIAFTFYLLDRFSKQPAYATVSEMMYSLPTLFVFFLTGVIADRLDRKKVLLSVEWVSMVLSMLLLIAIWVSWMPLIFAVLFARSGVANFFPPAHTGLIQGILSKEDYPTAIGLNQMLNSVFIIAGNGLGALVYWKIGIYGAVIIDITSFLLSGFLIFSCVIKEEVRLPNGRTSLKSFRPKQVISDFSQGVKYVISNKVLFTLLLGILILGIMNGGTSVMHIFILKYKLAPNTYESMQILLTSVLGIGIFVGSIYFSRLAKKIALYKMIITSFLIMGCVFILQGVCHSVVIFIILHAIYALSVPLCNIAFFGWLGQLAEPKMMGRVHGLITPLMMITVATTQGIIAIIYPEHISIDLIFYIVGGTALLLGVYYLVFLPLMAKKRIAEEMALRSSTI